VPTTSRQAAAQPSCERALYRKQAIGEPSYPHSKSPQNWLYNKNINWLLRKSQSQASLSEEEKQSHGDVPVTQAKNA
jgi:hypothetical protein